MKINYIILGVLTFFANEISAQTFRNGYDNYEYGAGGHGQGFSFDINIDIPGITPYALGAGDNIYMESYIAMYKATKDKKYLDLFIIHAFRVQTHRDDFVQNNIAGITGTPCSNLSAYPTDNNPTWSRDNPGGSSDFNNCDGWVPLVLDNGNITYPMAEFIYLMQVEFASDPDLQNSPVPTEVLMPTITSFNPYNTVTTYSDFAEFLKNKVTETITYFESTWHTDVFADCEGVGGYYVKNWDNPGSNPPPIAINMETAMGRTLVLMSLIPSPPPNLLTYITGIAHRFYCYRHTDPNDPSSYYWLDYDCVEDVNHSTGVMSFADLCYQYQIKDVFTNQPLFSFQDMQMFGNAFVKHAYQSPRTFSDNIAGGSVNVSTCGGTSGGNGPGGNTFLCQYNPYAYQIISDVYSSSAIYGDESGDLTNESELALYEHLFNPIAVIRGTNLPGYKWRGATSGDFNGDGVIEFAGAQLNHEIAVYTVNNTTNRISYQYGTGSYTIDGNNWTGLASGDFDGINGDEIVAITGTTISILKQSSGNFTTLSSYTASGAQFAAVTVADFTSISNGNEILVADNSTGNLRLFQYASGTISELTLNNNSVSTGMAGLGVGNFDGNNNKEIAVVDNSYGYLQVFSIQSNNPSNGTLTLLNQYTATGNGMPGGGAYNLWNGLASGDFDGDGIDEIITHRDYDGQFFVSKIKSGVLTYGNDGSEYFPIDQQNGVMCSSHLNISSTNSLVTLRNYDSQITIFNMEGLCQGVELNNITVDNNTTIDNQYTGVNNNYPVDYHANNTLTASNFTVVSGSSVVFTAGNSITLLPGFHAEAGSNFHAYIDPSLGCDDHTNFRLQNNSPKTTPVTGSPIAFNEPSKTKTSDSLNANIAPNPNNGKFILQLKTSVKNGTNEIFIYNTLGLLVQHQLMNSSIQQIDLSSQPKGMYLVKVQGPDKIYTNKVVVQ